MDDTNLAEVVERLTQVLSGLDGKGESHGTPSAQIAGTGTKKTQEDNNFTFNPEA